MDPINILIVEDEAILSMDLTYRLTQMGYNVVDVADNGPQALAIAQAQTIDLALLDIHILGEWDGIETARQLVALRPIPFIFLTAMTDGPTIERARQVSPSAYITKPFNDLNLRIAVDLAVHNFATQQPASRPVSASSAEAAPAELTNGAPLLLVKDYVFIKQNYRFVKFRLADILYFHSEGNYTDIITKDTKYTLRMVLNKVLERFQQPGGPQPADIVRIHRSYAVNLRQIDSFNEQEVHLGPHTIPIGRSFRDDFIRGFEFR